MFFKHLLTFFILVKSVQPIFAICFKINAYQLFLKFGNL